FGHILYWNWYAPASTAFMERRLEALRLSDPAAQAQQQWVPYERIAVHLKRAAVVAEDARFLDHEGFDSQAIQLAMAKNEERGRLVAGASTISQQLARNLFLSGERSWIRKAQEAAITWMLEHTLSKRRILELYLNVAEWGDDGVFGAEAAARYHFGVPASALSQDQAAWLAAILPSPRRTSRTSLKPCRSRSGSRCGTWSRPTATARSCSKCRMRCARRSSRAWTRKSWSRPPKPSRPMSLPTSPRISPRASSRKSCS